MSGVLVITIQDVKHELDSYVASACVAAKLEKDTTDPELPQLDIDMVGGTVTFGFLERTGELQSSVVSSSSLVLATAVLNLLSRLNNNNNNRIQRRCSRFVTISSQRRELSPTRTLKWPGRNRVQVTCNTSSACHVQHVVLLPPGTKGQHSC